MNIFIWSLSLTIIILSYFFISFNNIQFHKYNNATLTRLPFIDLPHFNYNGKCGELFQYPPSSQRDLIMYSHAHSPLWNIQQFEIEQTLTIMRASLPNVTAVVFTIGEIPLEFSNLMKRFNVIEVPGDIKYENWNGVNARIPLALEYLKNHQNQYDRVIWSDLRDVFYFTDIFKTFSSNDLYWLAESTGTKNFTFYNRYPHFVWMLNFKGKKMTKKFMENGNVGLNGGLGMGGIHKMIQFLNKWNDLIEFEYVSKWGYDQTLLNLLTLNEFVSNNLHLSIEKCTQRMCFIPDQLSFNNGVAYYPSGCSPIVTHKGVPDSWRSVNGSVAVPEDK
ncbi:hypothetical protein ENUP19_0219G0050 [Entamoeba nuttalli]|uniref:Uncharacterized protein n=2 Tax=Entamoeba nuttalli TaxID=412467 RepID=K2G5U4_ENTNP|nr:hypothetical protein ENU1_188060 [Entamoeba nuttalli P19]EKE37726.1 hypothetical protein ENU1_188060 [Entamoeba nuttalli P19]|eukprot:XP_008859937.1 hypothetical protein ENU1_188060 [Entamoeba nuttalli P19]